MDARATDGQRLGAANALADYAEKDVARFARLLPVATPEQFAVFYPIVAAGRTPATIEDFCRIAATPPPDSLGSVKRVTFGQRRAGAAVTLLRLGERERVLPVFEVSDDPEALTQFIFRCRAHGVGADAVLDCVEQLKSRPANRYLRDARYALLLALGEFTPADVSESRQDALVKRLADWYRHDLSSGVHGARGLAAAAMGPRRHRSPGRSNPSAVFARPRMVHAARHGETHACARTARGWSEGGCERGADRDQTKRVHAIERRRKREIGRVRGDRETKAVRAAAPLPKTFFYTFIVFPPGEFMIGSVNDEPGRMKNEVRHRIRIAPLRAPGPRDHL